MMKQNADQILTQLATRFLQQNYDYIWLTAMLEKCASAPQGATLVTGSSHALNGIDEKAWTFAVNCSMHSQDIYYDFQCAKRAIERANPGSFVRCFIVMGYYIAYQDLSRSKISRETVITNIYDPIFQDAHNWEIPSHRNLWDGIGDLPDSIQSFCEQACRQKLLEAGAYYSAIRHRGALFDLKGRTWAQVSPQERLAMGQARAADHNKIFQHKASLEENKQVLQKFVRYLYANDVLPVVVITPFTPEYNRFVLPELKAGVAELLDAVPDDVHYVDFNQAPDLFTPEDFMDTDHLSATGARKISDILAEMFGI